VFTIVGGSVNGCDSIITLNLTIINAVTGIDFRTACDSLTWIDGITYFSSTNLPTFTFAGGSTSGADSIVTLNLTLNYSVTYNEIQSACDSFTWIDGITYLSSTNTPTFTFPGASAYGCDSIINLNLTLYNSFTAMVGAQICTGQSYTLPDGTIVNSDGAYPVSFTSSDGCDSTIITNLTVLPANTPFTTISSITNIPVCQGSSISYVASSVFGGSNPAFQWFLNGVLIVGQTNDTIVINTLNNGDSVRVQMTSNDSCVFPTVVNSNVIVQSLTPIVAPSVGILSNPMGLQCSGTVITFSALPVNGGANPSFQWFVNGNPVGLDSILYTDSLLSSGDSIYVVMNSSELCVTDTNVFSNVIVQSLTSFSSPSVTLVPNDTLPACEGVPLTFTAVPVNGGLNPVYEWYINGVPFIGQSSATFITASLNDSDIVSVLMTSSLTCASPDSALSNSFQQFIIQELTPSVSIVSMPMGVQCASVPITFTATPVNGGSNPTLQWYINSVPVLGQNGLTFTSTSLNNGDIVSAGIISNLPCADSTMIISNTIVQEILLTVEPAITIVANRLKICEDQSINFMAVSSGTGSQPVFNWFVNNVLKQSGFLSVFSFDQFNNGDVVFCSLNSSYLCISEDTVISNGLEVNVNPLPYVNLQNEYTSFIGDSIQLITDGSIDNIQYSWSPSLYLDCPSCPSPISIPYEPVIYFVTLTDTLTGCYVSDSVIINLETDVEIYIPSAFSPNSDGFNDVLYLRGYNIVDFVLRIYDRFGELVFQTQSMSFGWDGTYKGKDVSPGAYYYYLDYRLAEKPKVGLFGDETLSKKGSITLVR
jgi:gliding motility-associated-like protein